MLFFSVFLLVLYGLRFRMYWKHWRNTAEFKGGKTEANLKLSILIPFRNEKKYLPDLIQAFNAQDYPLENVKFIFINDHSTDGSELLIGKYTRKSLVYELIHNPEGNHGKKMALYHGVINAQTELIIITDADCIPEVSWIRTMVSFYQKKKPDLISGPVRIQPVVNVFSGLQALELNSLTGSGGASFLSGSPVMCNGANLAFKKELFMEAFADIKPDIPSGDDVFLMLYAKKQGSRKMHFLKSSDAIVNTAQASGLMSFFRQRTRWTSKSIYYRDRDLVYLSLLIFMLNFWLLVLLFGGFYQAVYWYLAIFLFAGKSSIDFIFLGLVNHFYRQTYLMKWFFFAEIFYPFYIFIAATGGWIRNLVVSRRP